MPSKAGLDNHSPSSKGNNGEAVPPKPAADYEETLPSTSMEDALTAKIVIPPSGASLKPDVMIEMQTCDAAINIALVDSDLNLPPFVVTEMIPPKPAGCEVAHQQAGCDEKYVHVPDDDDEMAKIDGQNWPNENTAPRTCVEETGGRSGVYSVTSAMLVAVFGATWTSTTNTPTSVMMVAFSAACTSSTNTPKYHCTYPHCCAPVANRREESARWPTRAAGWLLVVVIMTINNDGAMAKVTPRLGDVEAARTLAGINKLNDLSASTSIAEETAEIIIPPSVASIQSDDVLIGDQTDTVVKTELKGSDENSPPFVATKVVLPTTAAESWLPDKEEDQTKFMGNNPLGVRTKVVAASGMRRNDKEPTIGSYQKGVEA